MLNRGQQEKGTTMTIKRNQAIAVAASAMIAVSFGFTSATAAPVSKSPLPAVELAQDIEVGSQQRRRYRRGNNNAAAAAVMLGVIGTAAAVAASESRRGDRRYYDDRRYYRGAGYRGGYCGHGPAGPIPPGGYWHYGTFYGC